MTSGAPGDGSSLPVETHRIEVPRSARYCTAGGGGAVQEVWFLLHGYSMLAERFIRWFSPAAAPDRLLVAPEALNLYYRNAREKRVGATWMTSEDREAHIGDYVRYLDLVRREVLGALGAAARHEVHGFSQGAATACRWVAFGENVPARLVLWGGLTPHDMDLSAHSARLSDAHLTLVIGDRDEYIPRAQVEAEEEKLKQAGVRYELRMFRGGHVIPWPEVRRLSGVNSVS